MINSFIRPFPDEPRIGVKVERFSGPSARPVPGADRCLHSTLPTTVEQPDLAIFRALGALLPSVALERMNIARLMLAQVIRRRSESSRRASDSDSPVGFAIAASPDAR